MPRATQLASGNGYVGPDPAGPSLHRLPPRHPGQLSGLLIKAHVPGAPVSSAHHLPAQKSKASQRPTARRRLDLQMWLVGNRLLNSRKN